MNARIEREFVEMRGKQIHTHTHIYYENGESLCVCNLFEKECHKN